jgi:hypothetical protein
MPALQDLSLHRRKVRLDVEALYEDSAVNDARASFHRLVSDQTVFSRLVLNAPIGSGSTVEECSHRSPVGIVSDDMGLIEELRVLKYQ